MKLEVISHQPHGPSHPTPILFVHGAWQAAWCWENFQSYFAQHGYASHAVSLRGHGESEGRKSIRWHSAAHGYVDDVAQIVNTFSTPPVIVGHSLGGYVVQKYLESNSAAACVLLTPVPVFGIFGFAIRYLWRHPKAFLKAQLLLNPGHFVSTPELAKDTLFSPNMPSDEFMRHFVRLQSESFIAEFEAVALNLPRPTRIKTPILVLGAANDRVFTIAEHQATAHAYKTNAEIFPGMAHEMMLERGWQRVADRILL